MKKIELADVKEHFSYCIDEGLTIGEQEERFLQWLYNKVEQQQKLIGALGTANDLLHDETIEKQHEIERYKDLLNKCDLVIKTKKHNMENRDVYVVDVDDLKEALGNKR